MNKPLIRRAKDNKSKGKTYAVLIRRYNEAIEKGFYGEAELLVYALLEDRLRSFIYYSDLLDNYNNSKINENAETINGGPLDIKDISRKICIIKRAIASSTKKASEMKAFEKSLRKRYAASIKIGELKKNLNHIEKWCKYRNEIVHALFNKDLVDLHKGYKQHVQSGMELARYVDNQVKALKKA